MLAPGSVAYDTLGVVGAYSALLGLLHRDRIGKGQHIDVSAVGALAGEYVKFQMRPLVKFPVHLLRSYVLVIALFILIYHAKTVSLNKLFFGSKTMESFMGMDGIAREFC